MVSKHHVVVAVANVVAGYWVAQIFARKLKHHYYHNHYYYHHSENGNIDELTMTMCCFNIVGR